MNSICCSMIWRVYRPNWSTKRICIMSCVPSTHIDSIYFILYYHDISSIEWWKLKLLNTRVGRTVGVEHSIIGLRLPLVLLLQVVSLLLHEIMDRSQVLRRDLVAHLRWIVHHLLVDLSLLRGYLWTIYDILFILLFSLLHSKPSQHPPDSWPPESPWPTAHASWHHQVAPWSSPIATPSTSTAPMRYVYSLPIRFGSNIFLWTSQCIPQLDQLRSWMLSTLPSSADAAIEAMCGTVEQSSWCAGVLHPPT